MGHGASYISPEFVGLFSLSYIDDKQNLSSTRYEKGSRYLEPFNELSTLVFRAQVLVQPCYDLGFHHEDGIACVSRCLDGLG